MQMEYTSHGQIWLNFKTAADTEVKFDFVNVGLSLTEATI
jgi:hypothetical protein